MANLNIAIQIAAQDQASGVIGRIKGALGGLGDTAQSGFKGLQNVATVAGGALVGGVGLAAGAIVGFGAASVSAFAPFEQQMNEVFTLLPGITKSAMDQMTGDVLGFSKEFGALPNEVVPALYQSLSAGVPPDNVFQFLEVAQKAAVGGITDLETSVDGITSVVNAYGAELVDASKASDVMFTAVRLGKTDFNQLSTSLFNVIPSAASLGVSFEDVAANLATLTAQGVPTSVATTQIRSALNEAANTSGKLGGAIQELTGKSFTDLIAEGQTSAEIFNRLRGSMPEQEFRALFGSVEAMNAVLGLTGPNADTVAAAMDEMRNATGATDQAFDTMDQGILRAIERLRAFGATALIQVGDSLSPLVNMVLDFAEGALPTLQTVLDTMVIPAIETVAEVIRLFTANLQEGMGPLDAFIEAIWGIAPQWLLDALTNLRDNILPGLTEFFTNNVQPLLDFVTEFVSWKDVLLALGLVVASIVLPALYGIVTAAAPVIAVGAALVGAIALARNAWENDWGGIRTAVEGAIAGFWPFLDQVKVLLDDFIARILPALNEAWLALSDAWTNNIQPALGELWTSLQNVFAELGIGTEETSGWDIALALLKGALDGVVLVVQVLTPLIQFYGDVAGFMIRQVSQQIDRFVQLKRGIEGIIGVIGSAIERVRNFGSNLADLGSKIPSWLIPGSPTPFETGLRGIGRAIDQMPKSLPLSLGGGAAGSGLALAGAGAGSGGGVTTFQITINANDEAGGRRAGQAFVDELRSRGLPVG